MWRRLEQYNHALHSLCPKRVSLAAMLSTSGARSFLIYEVLVKEIGCWRINFKPPGVEKKGMHLVGNHIRFLALANESTAITMRHTANPMAPAKKTLPVTPVVSWLRIWSSMAFLRVGISAMLIDWSCAT